MANFGIVGISNKTLKTNNKVRGRKEMEKRRKEGREGDKEMVNILGSSNESRMS